MCRRNLWRWKIADSSGATLSGAGLLAGSVALRRLLRREVLAADERYVGVLLPPSVGAALVNAALAIDRRIAVNLNYTLPADVLNGCIAQCGIRHVLTSPRLAERFPLKLAAETVHVEQLRDRLTWRDKLAAAAQAWLLPAAVLERRLRLTQVQPDDLLTVMFTSGSTGQPKGVMLSQRNLASNMDAFGVVLQLTGHDVLLGVLPMFHSFGYTTTLWTALTMDPRAVYHYTPLEAREIGRLCRRHGATILVAAPTFLRGYLRRCEPEDLPHAGGGGGRGRKAAGRAGRSVPAAVRRAADRGLRDHRALTGGGGERPAQPRPQRRAEPPRGLGRPPAGRRGGPRGRSPEPPRAARRGGRPALGQGAQRDAGLFRPSGLTAEVLRDGWYSTGDVAAIDADGFLWITGRLGRFSKIGGEMVPHVRVEESDPGDRGAGRGRPARGGGRRARRERSSSLGDCDGLPSVLVYSELLLMLAPEPPSADAPSHSARLGRRARY